MSASRSGSEDNEQVYQDLFMDAETGLDEDDADFEPDDDDEDAEDDGLMADIFEDGDEFHDTEEGNVEFVVEVEDAAADADAAGGDNAEDDDAPQRTIRLIGNPRIALTQRQLLAFYEAHIWDTCCSTTMTKKKVSGAKGDSGAGHADPNRFPKVPSDKGMELMNSGTFGATGYGGSLKAKKRIARRILDREMGLGNSTARKINQGLVAQSLLPTTDAEMQINYDEPVYSGQFSDDGNFFYSCVKDFKVRMYDTSNPYNWRHYKTVAFPGGSWTLTDASLSPDNKWLAYTSIESRVCLAPTDPNDTGDPYMLNLAGDGRTRSTYGWRGGGFGIWSIRFSGDGKELVAGTNANSIVVYDIETRQVLHSIEGHGDHVNAVCFADKLSPHILYSGSDDATIKVWDRRSMGDGREAGAFVGHVEGLTYIDSKGDGRYILSNGKDQSMKLWDLKMMYTTAEFREKNPTQHTGYSNFDYRWGPYDDNDWFPHPDDNSVVTFRGHKVLRTLIRCHFSPPGSTDSRYVYSGSHDGKVWVYNMDATVAAKIDVRKASMNAHALPPRWRAHHQSRGFRGWSTVVRDASWHPNAPFIAASSLNGWDHHVGTVTVHSFNENNNDEGEPRMGSGYTDKLKPVNADHGSESSGQWEDEDEEEEEEEEEDEDDDDEDGGLGI